MARAWSACSLSVEDKKVQGMHCQVMTVRTSEPHLCVCVCACSLTWQQYTQGQLRAILRPRQCGRIWRLASMSWRWPMNYGHVVFWRPLLPSSHPSRPLPSGEDMAVVLRQVLWRVASPPVASAGISPIVALLFFVFFAWLAAVWSAHWLGLMRMWGCGLVGFYTRNDMHTPTHTDSSPLGYEPPSLVEYQKAFFFSLYNFLPLLH